MIRFGTDGIRGLAGYAPCTPEVALGVGRAAARLGRRVLVARDTRPSGEALACAVAAGVAGEGGTARLAGVLPSAGLSAAISAGHGDVGVMITASHNPASDNGFKVLGPGGRKLSDAESARVEEWIATPGEETPGALEAAPEALDAYVAAWSRAAGQLSALSGRRLAIDLANGAATAARGRLPIPADVVWLGTQGLTNDGVGSEHPGALQEAVLREGCDAGLAVDGDADRCLLVDERGEVVPGDALAWLLATGLGAAAMAVTVMSNAGLRASLPGVRLVETDVGDRNLAEAMAREGLPLGCEESGHVLFADGLPTGDGLLTGVRALALASGPLSAALAGYHAFPRRLTKVRVSARPPLDHVVALEAARVLGAAALGPGGRIFLRYSGTEPLLRLLVEGADAAVVASVSDELTRIAAEALG